MGIFLIAAGLVFILFGLWSLRAGKTIGLHGAIEKRNSPFYWIIVFIYLLLGLANLGIGIISLFLRK